MPHGADWAALRAAGAGVPDLRPELRLPRHLLEQSPPHVPGDRPDHRRDPVGQSASAVLAVARAVRDGVDGREPFRRRCRPRSTASSCCSRASRTSSCSSRSSSLRARTRSWRRRSKATSKASCRRCCMPSRFPLAFVHQCDRPRDLRVRRPDHGSCPTGALNRRSVGEQYVEHGLQTACRPCLHA